MFKVAKVVKGTLIAVGSMVAFVAATTTVMMVKTPVPPDSEFGYGPRVSGTGAYTATLLQEGAFPKGKMITTQVKIETKDGAAFSGATLEIDGGMPQHGHGLPTKPRVTREPTAGTYEISGLKFNMGGWWELKIRIQNRAQPDSVVFNIKL